MRYLLTKTDYLTEGLLTDTSISEEKVKQTINDILVELGDMGFVWDIELWNSHKYLDVIIRHSIPSKYFDLSDVIEYLLVLRDYMKQELDCYVSYNVSHIGYQVDGSGRRELRQSNTALIDLIKTDIFSIDIKFSW